MEPRLKMFTGFWGRLAGHHR